MRLVITEKPSVAQDLAKVMGGTKKEDGFISGAEFYFTWCFGHMLQLAPPSTYGATGFSKEHLPIIPDEFILVPRTDTSGNADKGVLKQLQVIKSLFQKASEIIIATDAGREGELIFRYVYSFLGITKPLYRLWLSSMTDKAILEAFRSLKPGVEYENLYLAAKSRSEADWLIGINATQALTVSLQSQTPLSLGRVQTPTLAMICQRYIDFTNFKSEKFYKVRIGLKKEGLQFTATSEKSFSSKDQALELCSAVMITKQSFVSEFKKQEISEPPPLLFDLTSLQQAANQKYSLTADQTLKAAQVLYESKFITYPRTGSRYITTDLFERIPEILKVQAQNPDYGQYASALIGLKLNNKSVNSEKVTDHHALLTTERFPDQLTGDKKMVYDLISCRVIEAFSENCKKESKQAKLESASESFIASASSILYPGWRAVSKPVTENTEDQEEVNSFLPDLEIKEKVPILESSAVEKVTKPKPLHTEATLLKAMETAGKDITDESVRESLKGKGIGTPATRASIIEILFTRGYIERKKKSLIPTVKGLFIQSLVKDLPIASAELTGEWEYLLSRIESGEITGIHFQEGIIRYTHEITSDCLSLSKEKVSSFQNTPAAGISCPKCKSGKIRIYDKAANCSRSKEGCNFVIFRSIAGKTLNEKTIKDLLINGKTGIIKGFKSKTGNSFDAFLTFDPEFKAIFKFPEQKRK